MRRHAPSRFTSMGASANIMLTGALATRKGEHVAFCARARLRDIYIRIEGANVPASRACHLRCHFESTFFSRLPQGCRIARRWPRRGQYRERLTFRRFCRYFAGRHARTSIRRARAHVALFRHDEASADISIIDGRAISLENTPHAARWRAIFASYYQQMDS